MDSFLSATDLVRFPFWAFRELLRLSGTLAAARALDKSRHSILRVVGYHRIVDRAQLVDGNPALVSATTDNFARQMHYLTHHYSPISAELAIAAINGRKVLPPRAVLVTFDDGYRDFLTHAWPILRRYDVPAVLFVPTAFPASGEAFWWDLLYDMVAQGKKTEITLPGLGRIALRTPSQRRRSFLHLATYLRRLPPAKIREMMPHLCRELGVKPRSDPVVMTWKELRRLSREGLAVASHTRDHPALPALTAEEIRDECARAHRELARELGDFSPMFSYPFGLIDRRAWPYLREIGVVAAFTSDPGTNIVGHGHPLMLYRFLVGRSTSFTEFQFALTASYTLLFKPRLLARQWRIWRRRRVRGRPGAEQRIDTLC